MIHNILILSAQYRHILFPQFLRNYLHCFTHHAIRLFYAVCVVLHSIIIIIFQCWNCSPSNDSNVIGNSYKFEYISLLHYSTLETILLLFTAILLNINKLLYFCYAIHSQKWKIYPLKWLIFYVVESFKRKT